MPAIALSGFMACGKSFFGKAAAERLGWRFCDLDEEIAKRKASPSEIFRSSGEEGFRKVETEILEALLSSRADGENVVLALGGGTVLRQENIVLLRKHHFRTLWLDTSMDIIWSEMGNSERPLARGRSRREMEEMLVARRPVYSSTADMVLKIDSSDYVSVIDSIVEKLRNTQIRKVTVFLGSHSGNDPKFCNAAREFGRRLAEEGYGIVYGGSNVGTMGALAGACIEAGGSCTGVFPEGFGGKPEVAALGGDIMMKGLTSMCFASDFPERKRKMNEMGDCCVALPGSWGTLDELITYGTDTELKFNDGKPIFVLNLDGYFNPLKEMVKRMYDCGFILEHSTYLITFCDSLDELMTALKNT